MLTHDIAQAMRSEASKVIVGQEEAFTQILIALFSGGHVLLEGVPGTAKTLMAKTLAALTGVEFKRVQFTPDLMPSDVIGTQVFEMGTGSSASVKVRCSRTFCWAMKSIAPRRRRRARCSKRWRSVR
jgi:MoxR-like ATPase